MSTVERRTADGIARASQARSSAPAYLYPLALGFVALPFTRALTVDVGFPLKIYEVIFPVATALFIVNFPTFESWFRRKLVSPLFVFVTAAIISYVLMVYTGPDSPENFRGGPVLDGLSRICYLLLNTAIFMMSFHAGRTHGSVLKNAWLVGCFCAVTYVIYTEISFILYDDALFLPGIERHQMMYFGPVPVTRSGVFEEGNFAGLYYLLSIGLALHVRRYGLAILAFCGLLLSLSTAAYVALLAVWGIYVLMRKGRIVAIPYAVVIMFLFFGVYLFFAATGKFELSNSSAAARLNEVMTAFTMFRDFPWFGVSLGQYGFQYYFYEWDAAAGNLAITDRHITNNIYAEILVETGIVGSIAFIWFIRNWLTALYAARSEVMIIFCTALAMLVGWMAYPTFNIGFIWAYIGLSTGLAASVVDQQRRVATARTITPLAGRRSAAPDNKGVPAQ